MATKDVKIRISEKGAAKTSRGLKKVDKSLVSMGKAAGVAAVAFFGVGKLIQGFKSAIDAAGKQELAEKKLATALGKTSDALLNQAKALQQVTMFGDEDIIMMQSMLAAFTNNEGEIEKLTVATLDLASGMGIDLKSAGDLLAKTIGSSTNALSRYGIEVNGAVGSTERLESLTGNIANLFGGQASAQAKTMTGSIEQMKNAIGDAAEAFGDVLAPVVIGVSKTIKFLAEGIGGLIGSLTGFFDEAEQAAKKAVLIKQFKDDKVAVEEFKKSMDGLTKESLVELADSLISNTSSLRMWNDEMETSYQKGLLITSELEERKRLLDEIGESTSNLAFREHEYSSAVRETVPSLSEYVETQREQLAAQEQQKFYNEMLIERYPELAEGLGLVESQTERSARAFEQGRKAVGLLSKSFYDLEQAGIETGKATKRAAQLQAIVDTYAAANAAYKAMAGIPVVGPGLGIAAAAAAITSGLANVASIEKAATGADFMTNGPQLLMVGDNPGGKEHVQVTPLGSPNVNGPQGGININFSGPITNDDYVRDFIIPEITKATRLNLA